MPKGRSRFALVAYCAAAVLVVVWCLVREPAELRAFNRVEVGMSLEEVEALLGPGEVIDQRNVPSHVVAVNPAEEQAFRERARLAGTVPTARDYATRNNPLVEGDVDYYWELGYLEIWMAFKNGRVCEKYCHDWNYL